MSYYDVHGTLSFSFVCTGASTTSYFTIRYIHVVVVKQFIFTYELVQHAGQNHLRNVNATI